MFEGLGVCAFSFFLREKIPPFFSFGLLAVGDLGACGFVVWLAAEPVDFLDIMVCDPVDDVFLGGCGALRLGALSVCVPPEVVFLGGGGALRFDGLSVWVLPEYFFLADVCVDVLEVDLPEVVV